MTIVGLLLVNVVPRAWAVPPPNNDVSDAGSNTAGGTGALGALTTGFSNTAFGTVSLTTNTTGAGNSAFGDSALFTNLDGGDNTAIGASTLYANTSGSDNTAIGSFSLEENSSGGSNTGVGSDALRKNTIGEANTAVGADALSRNSSGATNTAIGWSALTNNSTGKNNTASGGGALGANTKGASNTATGRNSLAHNTTGSLNTACGGTALQDNSTGKGNTAVGFKALVSSTGSGNVAIGMGAGKNLTTGDDDIYIGSNGVNGESGTIRIGRSAAHTSAFIAGIAGTAVAGVPVMVSNTGRLGVQVSSARYKRDIQPMGARTEALMNLRPVTYRYKSDAQGLLQYGLVAEEVAQAYPELVTYDRDGRIESVRYNELIAMLLNELQHERRAVAALESRLADAQERDAELATRLERLERAVAPTTVAAARP